MGSIEKIRYKVPTAAKKKKDSIVNGMNKNRAENN